MNRESKTCQNCKIEFTIEPEDFAFYEKIKVPPPTFCPECRYQRRLANRNEWNFYKKVCSLCGKDMVSIYSPQYPGPVYCRPCWWSDGWDPFTYGQEFDFSRSFFEQFHEFRLKVPHVAMANWHSVNSEYTNQALDNRNCYMCVSTAYSENCLYGYWLDKVRESVDCYGILQSEFLYECLNSTNCSHSAYLEDCADTIASFFLKDCRGCTSCFGCYGLRNKSYCWKNEQLTKEEYERRFSEFIFSHANISSHAAFNASEAENLRYCQDAWYSKDSLDCTEAWVELGYENEGVTAQGCIAVTKSVELFNSCYSELCSNSHDLFACVGLKKAEYCILNRPYEKTEYERVRDKIIDHMKRAGEWGEFFPPERSLFGYNETVAQDYFPLTEAEVLARGLRWYRRTERDYKISLRVKDIPEMIEGVDDRILQETIGCISQESSTKEKYLNCATAFRITEVELAFYRKMNIPIPQKCSPCRRQDRLAMRNPRKLWKRNCQCAGKNSENEIYQNTSEHFHSENHCSNEFETSYAPDRQEIVYCEECYQAEIA